MAWNKDIFCSSLAHTAAGAPVGSAVARSTYRGIVPSYHAPAARPAQVTAGLQAGTGGDLISDAAAAALEKELGRGLDGGGC